MRFESMSMLPASRRRSQFPILEIAGVGMVLIAVIVLVSQLGSFSAERQRMPASLVMGGVPVSNLSRAKSQAYIEQVYGSPVTVWYKDQELRLEPAAVSFHVNSESMLANADEHRTEGTTFWSGFWDYIWRRPEQTIDVNLTADYSEDQLNAWLSDVAARYDRPPIPAQPVLQNLSFANGQPGYSLEQEKSLGMLEEALLRPTNREVHLIIDERSADRPGMQTLKQLIIQYIAAKKFQGVASVYIIDLQTGEEIQLNVDNRSLMPVELNCDIAYASTSMIKIPIMVNFFRYLDWVPEKGTDDYKNLIETMTQSGNVSANAMLFKIGEDDAQAGADSVTAMVNNLGLHNTFLAVPLITDPEAKALPVPYISTPAREAARDGTCVNTRPDEGAQSTVKDLASLLDMIYQCAEYGGGGLIAAYPDEITQDECKMMLDFMKQNEEAPLIRAGVPVDTPVAHKHGWVFDTHGDSGIVFSPGGDYVLSMMLWGDVSDWMAISLTFPVMEGISAGAFNYYNPDMVSVPRRGQWDLRDSSWPAEPVTIPEIPAPIGGPTITPTP